MRIFTKIFKGAEQKKMVALALSRQDGIITSQGALWCFPEGRFIMSVKFQFEALRKGQLIGIIALSSACEESRFQRGVAFLESLGFKTRIALEPCKSFGKTDFLFSSDGPKARAAAFKELLEDNDVRAIIAARGAYGSMEVLPELELRVARGMPKPMIGFSDTTAILSACQSAGWATAVHGPSVESAFSRAAENAEARHSAEMVLEYLEGRIANPFAKVTLESVCGAAACAGPLRGGNLSILSSLMGTPWEPDFSGQILFLEETGERPYRIHRMLLQMKLAGKFIKLKGVVLGDFINCDHPKGLGPSVHDVLRNVFKEYGFPVVGHIPAGHGNLNFPLPLGVVARIQDWKLELENSAILN